MERIFKRKIYDQLLQWKQCWEGKTAILIEGARRVGKSTIVKQFAKNEYESYILIDFNTQLSQVNFYRSNSAYSCTNIACRCEFPQIASCISSL